MDKPCDKVSVSPRGSVTPGMVIASIPCCWADWQGTQPFLCSRELRGDYSGSAGPWVPAGKQEQRRCPSLSQGPVATSLPLKESPDWKPRVSSLWPFQHPRNYQLGSVPQGWSVTSVCDVFGPCPLSGDKAISSEHRAYEEEDVNQVRSGRQPAEPTAGPAACTWPLRPRDAALHSDAGVLSLQSSLRPLLTFWALAEGRQGKSTEGSQGSLCRVA